MARKTRKRKPIRSTTKVIPGAAAHNLLLRLEVIGSNSTKEKRRRVARAFNVSSELFSMGKDPQQSHEIYHRIIAGEEEVGSRKRTLLELVIRGLNLTESMVHLPE